jgi:hypothetical protein
MCPSRSVAKKSNSGKENSLQPKAIIQAGACVDSQITQEPKGQGDRTLKSLVYLPLRRLQPGRAPGRHAFRTLLTCDLYRSPPLGPPAPQLLDAISRRDRAGTGDGQALPRVGIEDREAWPPPPSGGRVMNNGIAPDRIRRGCPRRRSRARAPRTPGPPCVPDLQTFALPDAPDGLALHPPCSPFKR